MNGDDALVAVDLEPALEPARAGRCVEDRQPPSRPAEKVALGPAVAGRIGLPDDLLEVRRAARAGEVPRPARSSPGGRLVERGLASYRRPAMTAGGARREAGPGAVALVTGRGHRGDSRVVVGPRPGLRSRSARSGPKGVVGHRGPGVHGPRPLGATQRSVGRLLGLDQHDVAGRGRRAEIHLEVEGRLGRPQPKSLGRGRGPC